MLGLAVLGRAVLDGRAILDGRAVLDGRLRSEAVGVGGRELNEFDYEEDDGEAKDAGGRLHREQPEVSVAVVVLVAES